MTLRYRYESLPSKWPGIQRPASFTRKRAPFKATWWRTEETLERELRHLGAKEVVIALALDNPARDIRIDGGLRSDARPSSPRVLLSFTDKDGGRQHWPCDTFTDWQANLHAIALSLEALRKVERYGVVSGGRQYVGFKALPPGAGGSAPSAPMMTVEEAATLIAASTPFSARVVLAEREVAGEAIKTAKRRAHPDNGGSSDAFVKVSAAADVLAEHHGGFA